MGRHEFESWLRPPFHTPSVGFGFTNAMTTHELTSTAPDEALELYLNERATEVADSTLQAHKYRLSHFIRWCDQESIENINTLTGRDLHKYKIWRRDDGDLNPVSLKTQMDTLRVFVRFCESINAVESDLHSKVMSPTLSDGIGQRDVMLDPDEADKLLAHLNQFEYASFNHVLILLLWKTGLRVGSLHALDLDDFDPTDNRLAVRHRPETGTPLKNKRNGERLIALHPDTCTALDHYVEVNRNETTDKNGRKPLVTTSSGRPITNTLRVRAYQLTRPCTYGQSCPHDRDTDKCEALSNRECASKCPSSVSPHAVRRGSITHHLTQDVPEQVVSDRMNVSPDVLDKHYDKRSEEVKVEQRREYLDNI